MSWQSRLLNNKDKLTIRAEKLVKSEGEKEKQLLSKKYIKISLITINCNCKINCLNSRLSTIILCLTYGQYRLTCGLTDLPRDLLVDLWTYLRTYLWTYGLILCLTYGQYRLTCGLTDLPRDLLVDLLADLRTYLLTFGLTC